MKDYKQVIESLGLPTKEVYELPTSEKRFSDGAHFRLEIPGIASSEAVEALFKLAKEFDFTVNRVTETRGIMRATDTEIREMAHICKENGAELFFSHGPRASLDTSSQRATGTSTGGRVANRLRGASRLMWAVEDVLRACDLGVRGILLYDEGLLWVLNEMRKEGALPKDIQFKVSGHCGHGNPASFKLLASLGANSVNPVRDLELPMMASLRKATDVHIDLHIDNPKSTGGFIRTYEAPEMVRICSPVYLKCGPSCFREHASEAANDTSLEEVRLLVKQTSLVKQMVDKHFPEAIQSKPGAIGMAIPV